VTEGYDATISYSGQGQYADECAQSHDTVLELRVPIGLILLYGMLWPSVISWLTAGIVVLNIMSSGLLGDSTRLTNLRERGILRRVQATPLPTWQLIAAYVVMRLLLVLAQCAAIIATAVLAYGAEFTGVGWLWRCRWRLWAGWCSWRSAS
jgi:hypothetical protein